MQHDGAFGRCVVARLFSGAAKRGFDGDQRARILRLNFAPPGIAERPGTGNGPTVLIAGHLDTVFPEGTDVTVKRNGSRYVAPGIGDDDRGLAVVLAVARAFEKGETEGFMKVLVDAESRQILGATFLGASGDEAIHGILDMMNAGASYPVLQWAVPIHPTVSELIPTVLGDLKPRS